MYFINGVLRRRTVWSQQYTYTIDVHNIEMWTVTRYTILVVFFFLILCTHAQQRVE